jgi:hypothetical protein
MTEGAALCCPVCGLSGPEPVLQQSGGPATQNQVYRTVEAAKAALRGDLDFRRCKACRYVWNAAFDPTLPLYGKDYRNAQDNSPAFHAHLSQRLEHVARIAADSDARTIVEVGCGQGDFLRALAGFAKLDGVRFYGFDPALVSPGQHGALTLIDQFFDASSLNALGLVPEIVVTRHTIEHIHDPVGFLNAIAAPLPHDRPVTLFLETPDYNWIARNSVVFDHFYEHCSLFNPQSIGTALDRAGFDLTSYETPMGGQYMWVEALYRGGQSQKADLNEHATAYAEGWQARFDAHDGPVYFWGAGAKGITFATLVDPDGTRLDGLIDINPEKAGMFVPLTAHPIVSPSTLKGIDGALIVVGNPVYRREIEAQLDAMGVVAQTIDA